MRSKSQEAQNHDKIPSHSKNLPCPNEGKELLNFYHPKQERLYPQSDDSGSTGVVNLSDSWNIDCNRPYMNTNRKSVKKNCLSSTNIDKNSVITYDSTKKINEKHLVENKFNRSRTNEKICNRIQSFDKERAINLHSPNNGQVNLSNLDSTKSKNYISSARKVKQSIVPKLRMIEVGNSMKSSKDNSENCIDKQPTDITARKFNELAYMALRSSDKNGTKRKKNLEADSRELENFDLYNKPKLPKTDAERAKAKPLLTNKQAISKNKKRHLKDSSIVSSSVLFLQQICNDHASSYVDTDLPTSPTKKRSQMSDVRNSSIKLPSNQMVYQNTIENEDAVLLLDFVDSVTSSVSQYSNLNSNPESLADIPSTETKHTQREDDTENNSDETATSKTLLNCSDNSSKKSYTKDRKFDPYISTLVKPGVPEGHSSQPVDKSINFDSYMPPPTGQMALSINSEKLGRDYYKRCANHIKIAYAICYHRDQKLFRNLPSDNSSKYKTDHSFISTQSQNSTLHLEDPNSMHVNDGDNRNIASLQQKESISFKTENTSVSDNTNEASLPDMLNHDKPHPEALNLLPIEEMSRFQTAMLPEMKCFPPPSDDSAYINNLRIQHCMEQEQNDPLLISNIQAYQQHLLMPHNSIVPGVIMTVPSNSLSTLNLMNRGQPTASLQQNLLKEQPLFNGSFIMNASSNVMNNCNSGQMGIADCTAFRFPRSSMNLQNPIQLQLHQTQIQQTQLQQCINFVANVAHVAPPQLVLKNGSWVSVRCPNTSNK
ncbi:uncharacterized protein LOC126315245 [Schistocerca gregaria]|uniref:uncharacterized protein LOC126315245 n=1 Tax=Schistocerca gregaria TaxID=7010 RepID=UPI00211E437A|nr:uncharacterized protein LOC126315245 [Schistocerca gregaria]